MQVALVQCPPWGALPPLGTATLKAYLELHGHPTRCIDLNIEYCNERRDELVDETLGSIYARPDPWASEASDEWSFDLEGDEVRFRSGLADHPLPVERWADDVLRGGPQLVGFSVQFTNLGVTLQVAQAVRRAAPDVTIVFGGPNVAEDQSGRLALESGVPDAIVEGEGEVTLVEIIAAVERGADLGEVDGVGVLRDGAAHWTARRPLIADVDSLPFPDFSDLDWKRYPNQFEIPLMTSRGCVLNCAFCYETVYWKRYRTQSAERIVAEIEHQIAHHPLRDRATAGLARFDISLADSLVNGHLGGLRRMAQLLVDREVGICWNGQATVNPKMDQEFFDLLAASGCTGLSFGLESASQSVLESMGKRFHVDDAYDFFERVHRSGIKVIVNVMVGFPTETRADFTETLRFLARIRRFIFMVNNVSPTGVATGSRLHDDPERFSVVPVDLAGWHAGTELAWTSPATGDEDARLRRLRLLHTWMQVMRIPHQRLPERHRRLRVRRRRRALPDDRQWLTLPVPPVPPDLVMDAVPDGSGGVTWDRGARIDPAEADAAIASIEAAAPVAPLILRAVDQEVTEVLSAPAWCEPLEPHEWVGHHLWLLRDLLAPRVDGPLAVEARQFEDGSVESTLRRADDPDQGLRIRVLLPEQRTLEHRVVIVPIADPAWFSRAAGAPRP